MFSFHQASPGKEHKGDGEHAVDPEQGRVAMVHGQVGTMLVIVHNGQVDQKAKHRSAQEVPEGGGYQKIHGPPVGKLFPFLTDGLVFHQTARDQAQQRNRFHGREHGSHPEPE